MVDILPIQERIQNFLNCWNTVRRGTKVERRKIVEMNQFRLQYTYNMEMSQGNSLCSYLKQTKMSFFSFFYKIGEQEGWTGPSWGGWYQWERGGGGERVWEGEDSANTVYICMYTEK
jgi:hypothetical protein